jgi:hypothetical protein
MKNKWKVIALIEALVLCSLVIVSCKRHHDYDDETNITYRELEDYSYTLAGMEEDIDTLYRTLESGGISDDELETVTYDWKTHSNMMDSIEKIDKVYKETQDIFYGYLKEL